MYTTTFPCHYLLLKSIITVSNKTRSQFFVKKKEVTLIPWFHKTLPRNNRKLEKYECENNKGEMSRLPGTEVSKAGLAFGFLGRCCAGRWPTFIISWTFPKWEEYIIITGWISMYECPSYLFWKPLLVPFRFFFSYEELNYILRKWSNFLLRSLWSDKVMDKFASNRCFRVHPL